MSTGTDVIQDAHDWTRSYARVAGAAYLVTFAASIPAVLLLQPLLTDSMYVVTGNANTRVATGLLLDVVNAIACIATAVAVFPVIRRHYEALALGFVASRIMEAAIIMVGVVSLLAVLTLRQHPEGANPATLQATAHALVAVRNWTFDFGPNLFAAMNAFLFGTVLYRSRLVPRWIPTTGLIGAPLLLLASLAAVFGQVKLNSIWFIGAVPVAIWELSVGIYMLTKGFRAESSRVL